MPHFLLDRTPPLLPHFRNRPKYSSTSTTTTATPKLQLLQLQQLRLRRLRLSCRPLRRGGALAFLGIYISEDPAKPRQATGKNTPPAVETLNILAFDRISSHLHRFKRFSYCHNRLIFAFPAVPSLSLRKVIYFSVAICGVSSLG